SGELAQHQLTVLGVDAIDGREQSAAPGPLAGLRAAHEPTRGPRFQQRMSSVGNDAFVDLPLRAAERRELPVGQHQLERQGGEQPNVPGRKTGGQELKSQLEAPTIHRLTTTAQPPKLQSCFAESRQVRPQTRTPQPSARPPRWRLHNVKTPCK